MPNCPHIDSACLSDEILKMSNHHISFAAINNLSLVPKINLSFLRGRPGRDRMIVKFADLWSSNPTHAGEVYSMQHYVIKFVSGLRQVGGFLRIILFPPPIKLTATI